MTPRSLVGMTMGARKRRARAVTYVALNEVTFVVTAEALAAPIHCARFHARKFPRHEYDLQMYKFMRLRYRIGQRLRPCPGCEKCTDSPRLQVMGWVRRIGGHAKLTRIFSRWYQRAEYLLMIYRPGPKWNPAAGGGVTKEDVWANMCNCLREHGELTAICDGSGVLPARAKKVRR